MTEVQLTTVLPTETARTITTERRTIYLMSRMIKTTAIDHTLCIYNETCVYRTPTGLMKVSVIVRCSLETGSFLYEMLISGLAKCLLYKGCPFNRGVCKHRFYCT